MNTNFKKVSVIIPNYNSGKFLPECIDSVINQSYPNMEIIVIDDGSTDNSLNILESYANKIILITQKNQGACIARNKGLDVATGEYIKFLDSDDYLEPEIIYRQVLLSNLLDNNEIIYGDFTYLYDNGLKSYHKNKSLPENNLLLALINTDILTSTPLHRKKLLDKINGFDIRFKSGQEWNLHIRLANIGVKFKHHSDNVYFYRQHKSVDRISIKKQKDPFEELNKNLITLRDIIENNDCENIRAAFSLKIWKSGREYLLKDQNDIAEIYFNTALKIQPNLLKNFSLNYRLLLRIFTYTKIEKLVCIRKKFTKFRKKII